MIFSLRWSLEQVGNTTDNYLHTALSFIQKMNITGAVKVTPAHDPSDYECGKRHNLPMINIFTDDGLVNEVGGQFKVLSK